MLVAPVLDSMPAIKRGGRGHPRRRPIKLHADKGYADKGYDIPQVRRYLRRGGDHRAGPTGPHPHLRPPATDQLVQRLLRVVGAARLAAVLAAM
jgi:hypothetical protein